MSDLISTVIIDDQQDSIDDLLYLFEKHKVPIQVLGTANSGTDGLAAVLKHKPKLVFLDVVMPGMSGFEMIDLLPEINFHLIITTAVDKYAIQALRASALDFLLKPVKVSELQAAVQRAIEKQDIPDKQQVHLLSETMNLSNRKLSKIALSIAEGVQLVKIDDIIYFQSEGNYTTVFMQGDKSIVMSKPIGKYDEMLEGSGFFRVHHSFLVNLNYVSKFIRGAGGHIVLENGKTITVARSKKEAFLEALTKL